MDAYAIGRQTFSNPGSAHVVAPYQKITDYTAFIALIDAIVSSVVPRGL